jgi:hypothetical protein
MLGLAYLEADSCPGCGKSLTLSADPAADARDWLVTRHTCTACEMLAITQKALDTKEHKHTSAYLWTVEKQH